MGAPKIKTPTGREYLRVSQDRSGRQRSVEEQHADNQRAAAERGVKLRTPYIDNGVSASRYSRKTRDDFAKLLADLEHGRFGADELWLWESSRGSRRVGEWVQLIELCEAAKVNIYVVTHSRLYNPANARDRRSLLEDSVDSEYESAKVSMRAKRTAADNAAAGRPSGTPPFGYTRRYDERTRQLVAQEPHPTEAPVVKELFDRLKKGHSLRSITLDFESRGIRTRSGKVFSPQHLRSLALNPSYCGVRTHAPGKRARSLADTHVTATWEPLIPKANWLAVNRILTDPARKTTRPGRAKHLLSLIARCHECGGPLIITLRTGTPEYQCRSRGCVRVRKDELEAYAEQIMLTYLAEPDAYEALNGDDTDKNAELAKVRDELAELRHRLDALADNLDLDEQTLARRARALRARITELEERERDLATPPRLRGYLTPGKDVARRWKAAEISTKREVARLLLSPELLGELRVARRPEGRRNVHVPVDERVEWRTSS